MKAYYLSEIEREDILKELSIEQRAFLENVLKRGRKTSFAADVVRFQAEIIS